MYTNMFMAQKSNSSLPGVSRAEAILWVSLAVWIDTRLMLGFQRVSRICSATAVHQHDHITREPSIACRSSQGILATHASVSAIVVPADVAKGRESM